MIILKTILLITLHLFMLACGIMLIKNTVTYRNCNIISDAIFKYHRDVIGNAVKNGTILDGVKYEVEYDDMKDYNSIFLSIFDWGYKNILPADKFEIIRPYIHK